ncbi:DUF262 domain-containing protein [Shewanella sp. 3_MG-2023]|uniref:DUF262 domain-containing protein n=1 Tax=Shewanella sp. 3_MG-2023 TaxID=3062635 RepID=UPI0026E16F44|nr:DUF262 domain-containing protein [Shewanella sp. 3_MG-2023]MDO6773726.1 DUF262 domain-containing protein [Shewanella sp. 3_MG-2023]
MSKYVEELQCELDEELNIEDEAVEEEEEAITRYDITSYGIDFDVEGLVKRVNRGDIFIPPFQRNFVWKLPESSRLIESLLLGLPVPGIFLAQEPDTGKMLVIDGQQRLLSLLYFFKGVFNPIEGEKRQRVFRLSKVQPQYDGKSYEELDSKDRINLENCVIHATVVKQDAPADNDTSIYHIFERLNSGGRKLQPQEIRTAVYHGCFIDAINHLNDHPSWREIYGKVNERMKDQELIIRYFAMLEGYSSYEAPMKDFLNRFVKRHKEDKNSRLEEYSNYFIQCCDIFLESIATRPFRKTLAINVALYEAAMVGLTEKIKRDGSPSPQFVADKYKELTENEEFLEAISQSTGNKAGVLKRIDIAKDIFLRG